MSVRPAERVMLLIAALLTAAGHASAQGGAVTAAPGVAASTAQPAAGAASSQPAGQSSSMQGQSGISSGNPAVAATIADIAARARAVKEASPAQGAPTGPLPGQMPGVSPYPQMGMGPMGMPPLPGGTVREPGEPRLMSIAGRPGQERVEITFNGTIYNVSMRHPMLGTTGWRLSAVNVRDGSVRIDNTEQKKPPKGKATAGREASGYVISFSRRDPEFGSTQSAGSSTSNVPNVAGMPGAYR